MHFFTAKLQKWYSINKRELPWRNINNAYYIWLSEIIMQQTQVAQGLAYYIKFTQNYPTIKHLAEAPIDKVMKDWQGLGYYSRARNLHAAAKNVMKFHKGIFPRDYKSIRELKGVGDYTAAAIASFAFELPYAVVDGNVYRVLSRVFGIATPIDSTQGKKEFQELANSLLPEKNAGDHNQAIMEFGAIQCRPSNPDCGNCVLQSKCAAFAGKKVGIFPVKAKNTKVRNRYFNYIVCNYKDNVYLKKRDQKDIWQGLYEFYLVETLKKTSTGNLLKNKDLQKTFPTNVSVIKKVSKEYKHVLSHQHLFTKFYSIELKQPLVSKHLIKVKIKNIDKYAFPRLIEKYLKEENVIN